MKTLLLTLLSIGGLLAQSTPPNQLQIYSPAPPPVRQIGGGTVGQSGSTTLYYWVIARYSSGIAINTTPVAIFNTVGTANLSASNYVSLTWGAVGGATGYDVLRSTTPIYPANPTCTACAVTLNTPNSSITDTGAALSDYPPGGLVQSSSTTATIYIDNSNSVPYLNTQLLYRAAENLIVGLISGSIADGDCIEYSAGRLISAGAGCGSGGGLGDPGSNGIVVRTALNTTVARTLQEGTNITITYPDGVSGNPVINASAGGSANTPFAPSRETTSTTNDTIRLNCDAAPYCAIRVNGITGYTGTSDITARLSGTSNTNNLYIYYTPATNTIYCDENTTSTLTVAGCTAATTGGIPAGSIPIGKTSGTYAFTANAFDDPSTSPQGPVITWSNVENGAGMDCQSNGTTGVLTCAVDTTVIPTKFDVITNGLQYAVTAGTSTAYTLTTPYALGSPNANGVCVIGNMDETSGATPTLSVNGATARQIWKHNGTSAASAIATGDLIATQIYEFCYNTALNTSAGVWVTNPGGSSSGGNTVETYYGSMACTGDGGTASFAPGWGVISGSAATAVCGSGYSSGQQVQGAASFAEGSDQYLGFGWVLPSNFQALVSITLDYSNSSASGNVAISTAALCYGATTPWLAGTAGTYSTATITAGGPPGVVFAVAQTTVATTDVQSCAAGKHVSLQIGRASSSQSGTDTSTGTMYLLGITLKYTVN